MVLPKKAEVITIEKIKVAKNWMASEKCTAVIRKYL